MLVSVNVCVICVVVVVEEEREREFYFLLFIRIYKLLNGVLRVLVCFLVFLLSWFIYGLYIKEY